MAEKYRSHVDDTAALSVEVFQKLSQNLERRVIILPT